jgi:hypothetical protein
MGRRPAPHTQAKWPFGHLKQDGQMAIKRNKKNKIRCGAHTCAPPSLKGRATYKKKKKKSAPCFEKRAEWPFLFLKEAVPLLLIFFLRIFIENS